MAQNDMIIFSQFKVDLGLGLHDLNTDAFLVAYVDDTITPTAATADPRWGAGGTVNFSTNEGSGGNFPTGGTDITTTYAASGADAKYDGTTNLAYAIDPSNPADSRWAICYNNTDAGKRCVFAIDLGAVADGQAGAVNITWNASGLFTVA